MYLDQQTPLYTYRCPESLNCMTECDPSIGVEAGEQTGGRREERRARQRFREVEQAVVQPGRVSNKQALQHPLDDPQAPRVPDEVRSELA
jgi:hypothetical protein